MEMPDVYKDPNPKPEIAIALTDDFTACIGFLPVSKIKENLERLAPDLLSAVPLSPDFVKSLCSYLFTVLDLNKPELERIIRQACEIATKHIEQ